MRTPAPHLSTPTPVAPQAPQPDGAPAPAKRRLQSTELFRDGLEVEIEHRGEIYRMRVTASNKLILTK